MKRVEYHSIDWLCDEMRVLVDLHLQNGWLVPRAHLRSDEVEVGPADGRRCFWLGTFEGEGNGIERALRWCVDGAHDAPTGPIFDAATLNQIQAEIYDVVSEFGTWIDADFDAVIGGAS